MSEGTILELSNERFDIQKAAREWVLVDIEDLGGYLRACCCGNLTSERFYHLRNAINLIVIRLCPACIDQFPCIAPIAHLTNPIGATYAYDDEGYHVFHVNSRLDFYEKRYELAIECEKLPILECVGVAAISVKKQYTYKFRRGTVYVLSLRPVFLTDCLSLEIVSVTDCFGDSVERYKRPRNFTVSSPPNKRPGAQPPIMPALYYIRCAGANQTALSFLQSL